MPFFHLRSLVPNSPLNCALNGLFRPLFTPVVDGKHLQLTVMQSNYQISYVKKISHSFTITNSFLSITGALQLGISVGESSQIVRYLQSEVSTGSLRDQTFNEDIEVGCSSESLKRLGKEDNKETERRRKIGLANKGKTPWNKGRKHSAETRERIKERTIEALRDPKVRKKMSECPRAHSEEIKAKIGVAQRKVWRKRLKWKRLEEKFYLIWAESIAESAKRGGSDQQELDWDSYEKMKAEIALQHLQWAADKAKTKAIAKLRAARVAKERAEKMAWRSHKKKEKEEKAKARGEVKRLQRKSDGEKQELAISKGLKLKARITKIRQKKSIDGQIAGREDMSIGHQPSIEKLDIEFIKREKLRREVSLADQIRAAKKKRAESVAKEALTTSLFKFSVDERLEQLASCSNRVVQCRESIFRP